MKYIYIFLTALLLSVSHIFSMTVEYAIFELSGELPTQAEFNRLYNAGLLLPATHGSAIILPSGAFSFTDTQQYSYPVKFSESAEIVEYASTNLGRRFEGNVDSSSDDSHAVKFQFHSSTKVRDHIYLNENGRGMPQPIFHVVEVDSQVTLNPSEQWSYIGGITSHLSDQSDFFGETIANDSRQTFLMMRLKN